MIPSSSKLLTAAALLGAACQPAIPPYTVNVPPRLVDVRPPRSVAFVRGDVPLGGLESAIQGAIPREVAGSKKTKLLGLREVEVTWHLERRPVALSARNSGLTLEIALIGEVSGHADGVTCRAQGAGVSFTAEARPTLRPGGELALEHLRWKPELRGALVCDHIPVPLAPLLDLALEPLAGALAKGVEQIHIPMGPLLQAGLAELRPARTLSLGADAGDACLDLDPQAFVLSPVGGAGADMILKIGVNVAPRVTLGPCSAGAPAKTSSAGALVKVEPLHDQFAVAVAVAVPYVDLKARVAKLLVGQRFGEGDRSVTVDDVDLGDAHGRVLVRMPIRGVLTGMLYLWGTPTLTEEGRRWILRVPDLQVALESRSLLSQLVLVALQLKDGGLEALLRSKLTLDVTDRLTAARAALSVRHELSSGPKAPVLTTTLTSIEPGEVESRPGALVLHPILTGHAELTIESRSGPE